MNEITTTEERGRRKGMDLDELARELNRQKEAKKDYVADTRRLVVTAEDDGLELVGLGEQMPIRPYAHGQLADRLGIPKKFYDRLLGTHPDMLAYNVNELFSREPENRMVRTMDGTVRAFLSDRYRPLDHYDFSQHVLEKVIELRGEVLECRLSETRLYIKAYIPGEAREIKKPGVEWGKGHNAIHVLRPGICAGNSEVGAGSVFVEPGCHEQFCSNLMLMRSSAMRKFHTGKRADFDEAVARVLTTETRKASDRALWMQFRDLVAASVAGELFEEHVAKCEAALTGKELDQPAEAVKRLDNLTETEQDGILAHLVRGGDLSQYGLQYAVTEFAQTVDDADRSVELERFGGEIIELPTSDWERLAA